VSPQVSLIICTRDRCRSLAATLRSIAQASAVSDIVCELLVVDNGSTDDTTAVVRAESPKTIPTSLIAEPRQGQCHARNTGILQARGEVILFTDDDVLVPRNWISSMTAPILTGIADAVAGGVVFDALRRDAIDRLGLGAYSGWWASTDMIHANRPERMVGANMAFTRASFEKVGPFDVNLGPGALGFADETLFSFQLVRAGFRLIGRLQTTVTHLFDMSRLGRSAILAAATRMGRSRAYLFHHWEHERSRLAPLYLHWHKARCHQLSCGGSEQIETPRFRRLLASRQRLAFCQEYLIQRCIPPRYP
jgi:glucosyl-dolichyl phosphate glucuronosyltransferase